MPTGNGPPDPEMPQALFNTLRSMTYSSTNKAFQDGGGTSYWLFVEPKSGGAYHETRWFHATDSDGASSPKALVTQMAADVIINGTYNTTPQTITYNSRSYRIQLKRDTSNGNQLADAHEV